MLVSPFCSQLETDIPICLSRHLGGNPSPSAGFGGGGGGGGNVAASVAGAELQMKLGQVLLPSNLIISDMNSSGCSLCRPQPSICNMGMIIILAFLTGLM